MKTIAVIFGGKSTEHDVSIVTAIANVIKPLQLSRKYEVIPIYIARDGTWYSNDKLQDIRSFSGGIDTLLKKLGPISLRFEKGLSIVIPKGLSSTRKKIDIVFPSMHGTCGEDGALMGLLDMAGVPYVGCGLRASALAMDKVWAKQVAASHDIPVSKFLAFSQSDIQHGIADHVKTIVRALKYPLFIKPAHLGSSIGISRAKDDTELANALELAVHYDDKVIVEEAVPNLIEVTLPIIGNTEPRPALLERPLMNAEDFFDFDTKYLQGGKKGKGGKSGGAKSAQGYSELPAQLPEPMYKKAEAVALQVYAALDCSGVARVDMLIDSKSETVYFNEVNPLPGSLYAHNWRAAGLSNVSLVEKLVEYAEERFQAQQSLTSTFTTSYLQQFS